MWGHMGREETHVRDHDGSLGNQGLKKGDGIFFYIDWVPDPKDDVTVREKDE